MKTSAIRVALRKGQHDIHSNTLPSVSAQIHLMGHKAGRPIASDLKLRIENTVNASLGGVDTIVFI